MPRRKTTEEFIKDAKEVHGDTYDYSEVEYINTYTKVTIICPKHGEFKKRPSNYLSHEQGCPKCSGNRKKTTEEFIEDAIEVHGDKYDYSKTNYKGSNKKVTIICPEHGEFAQIASSHLYGHKCRRCSPFSKKTTEEFIKDAIEIHDDQYDYSKVNYKGSNKKVTIICPEHGEFKQTPHTHLAGSGCRECGIINNRKTGEEFIKESKEIHGDKYDYSKTKYVTANKKVTIICSKHGEFNQKSHSHLEGWGCDKCRADSSRKSIEEFIKEAREVHGDKYDYSKTNYINANKKVTIICPEHGEFRQVPNDHLRYKCAQCAGVAKKNTKQFIKKSREVHGDKYDYSKTNYKGANKKVTIICPEHGEFRQIASDHSNGHGCTGCKYDNVSKYMRKSPNGWRYSAWIKRANNSNNFDSFKLYIIKIYDKKLNKSYYKIGRTYRAIEKRLYEIAYDYEIIYIKESENAREICELESKYKTICKKDRYIPKREFGGMYECFESIEKLIEQENLDINE